MFRCPEHSLPTGKTEAHCVVDTQANRENLSVGGNLSIGGNQSARKRECCSPHMILAQF